MFPAVLLAWMGGFLLSCSQEEVGEAEGDSSVHTYTMRLNTSFKEFGQGTRAAYSWADGSKLYLQFFENGSRITGTATFDLEANAWTVTTSKAVTAPEGAHCEAYYFQNPSVALSSTVSLDLETVTYADKNGTYILEEGEDEDDVVAVTAVLSPLTGRIRFVGMPEKEYTVSGLTTYTSYSLSTNTFVEASRKLSVPMDDEGSSDYFYAFFDDESQLVVDGEGKSAYLRTFGDYVLEAGSSGFVTLPSVDALGAWVLVNAANLQEIFQPEVSAVTVSTIRSKSAGVTATVTSLNNGSLQESGIVCSTNSTPTMDNGTRYDGNASATISLRVKSLLPETRYYVRAYARNERGTAWGETVTFKTISEAEEGNVIDREGFENEDDLNDNTSTEGTGFDKEGFSDEDDLNTEVSTDGSGFDRTGFGEDDNLNTYVSTESSGFDKTGFGDDDDLNVSVSTNSSGFDKNGYGEDENWN